MRIRVATYNIHKGVSSMRGQPRVHALKQAIALFEADVVFLQEVQGRHDRNAAQFGAESHGHKHWPETAQHEFFAGASHHSAYGMNAVYDHGHHGNALLSAFPIGSTRNHDVSDHAYEQRGILHCVLQTEGVDVHCYVVHLGLFEAGRGRQTEALIEAVMASAPHGEPVIIAGDFNDWRNNLSDKLRNALGVVEVFDQRASNSAIGDLVRQLARRKAATPTLTPARTFPAALPWFRLDRIYVRGFQVETAQVMHGTLWAKLSDHAPIVATLKLA
ncbi:MULTISPECIES: endonuclease/exonuclease/phosphatase family protein [unclassified Janthinobacterium]|uniref:endonuclease/exonuclease/phosphatase family protein n=1 Tax=unclassified Janthinobacterium TaxID=2610881 RepID=UPI000346601D|nr:MULTISPECIES: endonuclease/exonuclease/phosphatase family protein [unclassified Janthinobacterium]MEC5159172.1 endonuclease/exonuclease/phosphatase family metal-dependent hydrolase [Janthinobacterium sp. CG_S6]